MSGLEKIEGVGPKTCMLLNKLGIYELGDLLEYYPKKYNVIKRTDMRNVGHGDKVIIDGVVEGQPTVVNLSVKLKKVIFRISNCSNIYNVSVFNQVYLCKELRYGYMVTVIGKFDKFKNTIVASEVRLGGLSKEVQIEPIYSTTEGLSRKSLDKIIQAAFLGDFLVKDYIPSYLQEKYHFAEKVWCMKQIHHPSDVVSYKRGLQRLKYEEFFLYLLRINYLKRCIAYDPQAISRKFDEIKLNKFIDSLAFSLTVDQERAISKIKEDLMNKRRMNRLVQGDVGSGKTIVAMIASYINFLSGYQTALMVPTEILANQHYENALGLFKDTGMKVCLLTSSIGKRDRVSILEAIGNGGVDLIIGTQSLIQEKVSYCNLGLIITDEQHRFGVNQRNELKNKGILPDILSMSATPIPRTYALTIYGDMEVSSIRTKPVGRRDVITYYKRNKELLRVLELMKKEIDQKHQVYVIAPAIDGDGLNSLDNVMKLKEKMRLAFGKIAKVEAVHGRLGADEKIEIMRNFEKGEIDILISTTVIEVGVNVPNASMIVIFRANLFGLSTLHQLRGRVGRGNIQSYCILLSQEYSERLKMLENTSDGFQISEYDFQHRGEGDLFGVRQSGEIGLKLANVKRDFDLLVRVKEDVDVFFEHYSECEEYVSLLKELDVVKENS